MYMNAYQLIQDCLDWAERVDGADVPERFAEMDKAMRRVALYVRTGTLG
jgi:hypothetical protein